MAIVPVAQQNVDLNPIAREDASARSTAAAFGGNDADALSRTGRATQDLANVFSANAERFRAREDAHAVRNAMLEFDTRTRELLNNQEDGIFNRKGTAAKGASTHALKSLDDYERDIAGGLNERQRSVFQERAASTKNSTLNSVARYESDEFYTAETESLDAALGSSISNALDAYRSPDLIDAQKAQGETSIAELAQLHGWSPEKKERKLEEYHSLLHKGVVERMLVDDPKGAREYFDANQGEIDGATELVLEKSLKVGGTRKEAQEAADKIFAEGGTVEEQRAKARDIDNAEVRDDTLNRVNARHAEIEQSRRERSRDVATSVWRVAINGGGLDDVPPHMLGELDGNTLASISNYIERKGQVETDWGAFSGLMVMDPRDLVKTDLLTGYRGLLADSQYTYLLSRQAAYRDALNKGETLDSIAAINTQVGRVADAAGLSGSAKAKEKSEFMNAAFRVIDAERAKLGRDLTPTELQKELAPLQYEVSIRGAGFWGGSKDAKLFQVLGTDVEAAFTGDGTDENKGDKDLIRLDLDDYPADFVSALSDKIKARNGGRPATTQEIAIEIIEAGLNSANN